MFDSFRLLGCVADSVPFSILQNATKSLVVVSVGHSWQAYDCDNLRVVLLGPKFKRRITALECSGNLILAAVKGGIEICRRVNKIGYVDLGSRNVLQMLRIGTVVVSLLSDNSISVWDIDRPEKAHVVMPDLAPDQMSVFCGWKVTFELERGFDATCMAHPATYVNKILIGNQDGTLQLWNFQKQMPLYKFTGWSSKVTCIESAPALDVVAVGLADGRAVLLNVKYDEEIHQFSHSASKTSTFSSCTALAFTTGMNVPLMASGGLNGEIVVWSLKEKELFCLKQDAHSARVASLHFFTSSAVLLSSSEDNSLKQWTVDLQAKEIRLLRHRSGPRSPPFYLSFYDHGFRILTCDKQGALWCLSTIQDQQNRELSTKKRLPLTSAIAAPDSNARPLALDSSMRRERDWGHVLSAHAHQRSPCLWSLKQFSIEKISFHVPGGAPSTLVCQQPTAVALSQCGNFGFIGYSCGSFHKFNVQSGLHRGEYRTASNTAHEGNVVGCSSDRFNRTVVSAGCDGMLRIWSFKDRKPLCDFSLGSSIHAFTLHRGNALCAVATDDLRIRVFDCEARRRVRQFHGHTDRLTCLEMSSDGRWLLTSSMDRSLRVYDIPSSNQIHVLQVKHPILSFSLSPSMELLATAHVNRSGVSLWTNQWIFGSDATTKKEQIPAERIVQASNEQKKLTKLAMMPVSGWSIGYGSTMKERNQVLKPAIATPAAPFFLPPLIGHSTVMESTMPEAISIQEPAPKRQKLDAEFESDLVQNLRAFGRDGDRATFCGFLKKQSPVYIEQEILSFSRDVPIKAGEETNRTDAELELLCSFLQFLEELLTAREDIEFSQVLLKLVLQSNATVLMENPKLMERIHRIQSELRRCWDPVESLMEATNCMLALFSGLRW